MTGPFTTIPATGTGYAQRVPRSASLDGGRPAGPALDVTDCLLERLDIGLLATTASDGVISDVNDTASRILGRDRAALIGSRLADHLLPGDAARLRDYHHHQLAHLPPGPAHAAVRGRATGTAPEPPLAVRLVRPGGSLVPVLIVATAVPGDDGPRVVSRVQDVTEQEQANRYLRLVLDHSPVSMLLIDQSGRSVFGVGAHTAEEAAGLAAAESASVFDVFADHPQPTAMLRRGLAGEPGARIVGAFGRYLDLHVMPIRDPRGQVSLVAAITIDITERENARAAQAHLADLARQALVTLEPAVLWRRATAVLAEHLGATATLHEVDGDTGALGVVAADGPSVSRTVAAAVAQEALRGPAGSQSATAGGEVDPRQDGWCTLAEPIGLRGEPAAVVTVLRPPGATGPPYTSPGTVLPAGVGAFNDSERSFMAAVASVLGAAAARFAAEREIRYRSQHDMLTDLPNRASLLERLRSSLAADHREGDGEGRAGVGRTGIVFVDLDSFKAVNDTYGHLAGDALLRAVAGRLRAAVRPCDVVARLAGDEFAVLCTRIESVDTVERVAARVLACLAEPVAIDGSTITITITASAGVAISGPGLTDPDRLLNASYIAMYAAKRAGAGRCVVHQDWMRLSAGPTPAPPE
ncbi:bifunctional diguanylate cyclase/phosphodiesterase [Candidatus Frankia alpina]|uniref:sensor domain-containing protein n=1 Tax=Candidatus Frankia alpina TaxID=2699483 RepID=UPI001F30CA63|nr:diguanylate cyclase [Candidatus Frankia alpina]